MTTDWTAFDRLLASRRRTIVESFADFLRLNSVSQEPDKVRATGEWLAAAMRARGLDGRVLETGGNPAVFGERRVPGATRTVLIYCHYDTEAHSASRAGFSRIRSSPSSGAGSPRTERPRSRSPSVGDDELAGLLAPRPRRLGRQGADLVPSERDRADGRGRGSRRAST